MEELNFLIGLYWGGSSYCWFCLIFISLNFFKKSISSFNAIRRYGLRGERSLSGLRNRSNGIFSGRCLWRRGFYWIFFDHLANLNETFQEDWHSFYWLTLFLKVAAKLSELITQVFHTSKEDFSSFRLADLLEYTYILHNLVKYDYFLEVSVLNFFTENLDAELWRKKEDVRVNRREGMVGYTSRSSS